jgi:hypothetical protein
LTSNDEIFITGTYNGFAILIRDNDGHVNASDLGHHLNQKANKRKELKSFVKETEFGD